MVAPCYFLVTKKGNELARRYDLAELLPSLVGTRRIIKEWWSIENGDLIETDITEEVRPNPIKNKQIKW